MKNGIIYVKNIIIYTKKNYLVSWNKAFIIYYKTGQFSMLALYC